MRFLADESVERKVVEKLREATDKVTGCPDKFAERREVWKMAFVKPSKGRAKITDLGERVEIEIPLHHDVVWVAYFFLLGWLFRLLNKLLPQTEDWTPLVGLLLLFGCVFAWIVSGILGVYGLLLQGLVRCEVITVSPVSLDIVTRPIGRLRRYRLTEISNMRVLEEREKGVIVFDYGVSTVRFGLWLDPAEARQIVALLKERFGQYMADGKVEAGS
jgi:hypothetical protein